MMSNKKRLVFTLAYLNNILFFKWKIQGRSITTPCANLWLKKEVLSYIARSAFCFYDYSIEKDWLCYSRKYSCNSKSDQYVPSNNGALLIGNIIIFRVLFVRTNRIFRKLAIITHGASYISDNILTSKYADKLIKMSQTMEREERAEQRKAKITKTYRI